MSKYFHLSLCVCLFLCSLAPGCKDKPKSSATSSTSTNSSSQSAAANKTPDFKLTPLKSLAVKPSDAPQTLVTDAVTVTLPPGLLKTSATLSISSVEDPNPPSLDALTRLTAVDVSMGDLKQFDKPLRLEFPLQEVDPNDEAPPELRYSAAYFDPQSQTWVELPVQLDPASRKLIVQTHHLCTVEIFMVGKNYTLLPCGRFGIFYDLKTVQSKTADYVSESTDPSPKVPPFISDIRKFANAALDAYEKHNLKPHAQPPYILVTPGESSSYSWNTRRVYVNFVADKAPDVQYVVSHELFHAVQHAKYYANQSGINIQYLFGVDHRWFLETSAEYFASRVAMPNYGFMGKKTEEAMPVDYLSVPLCFFGGKGDKVGRVHQYQNAWFIDYVSKKASPENPQSYAVKLYNAVADSSSDPLVALDAFFKSQHGETNSLAKQYSDFALYYLFSNQTPMRKGGAPEKVNPASASDNLIFELSKTSDKPKTLALKAYYTAGMIGVRANTEKGKERTYNINIDALPDKTAVHVCRLSGDNLTVTTPWILGSFLTPADAKKTIEAPIGQDDGLYLVAMNFGDSDQKITFKVEEKISLAIRRPLFEVEKGIIGAEYKFSPIASAIPDDAQFSWTFGDGASAQGKSVSHKYTSAGSYEVALNATWGNQKAFDKITFVIAPDAPADKKKEVAFQVYRNFKNAMGTSKQACNSFTLTVLKNGAVIDAIRADATNGSATLSLPAGENYDYQIDYKYSTPPGSGKSTGKFTVTSTGTNFVSIETGTESQ